MKRLGVQTMFSQFGKRHFISFFFQMGTLVKKLTKKHLFIYFSYEGNYLISRVDYYFALINLFKESRCQSSL